MTDSREVLGKGRWVALLQEGRYEYAERILGSGVAALFPVTDDGKVILVEQYRTAVHSRMIELPAGLVSDEHQGESMIDAARRELVEETGYEASEVIPVLDFPTSAGLTSERVNLFFAYGLKKVGDGGGDEHEQITVHEVPIDALTDWIFDKHRAGFGIDPKIFAAAWLREQKFTRNPSPEGRG
jgi:ADP-ribose pyrophosphatase